VTISLSPFQVQCPSCESAFPVDPARVPPDGIHAICSLCQRTFFVRTPEAAEGAEADTGRTLTPEPSAPAARGGDGEATEIPNEPLPAWDDAPTAAGDTMVEPEPPTGAAGTETTIEEGAGDPEAPAPPEPAESAAVSWDEAAPSWDDPSPAPSGPVPGGPEIVDGADGRSPEEDAGGGFAPPAPEPDVAGPAADAEAGREDLSGLTAEALAEDRDEEEEARQPGGTLSLGAARFGRRDPHQRARRLARVLVSDIIAYYPERHADAVRQGTVKDEFQEEVKKSRKEYVDQVGPDIADSTPYFREALNDILARGQEVF
jgi:predicted Zn finger-like uncharacterized protein